MRRLTDAALISVAVCLAAMCANTSGYDAELFTVEDSSGVRLVHNHAPQSALPKVKLELLGKIGKLDGKAESDILFDPVDAARLSNGDILILEGRGGTVKLYDENYDFVTSFGQPGQGPGDLMYPFAIKLRGSELVVAGRRVSMFSLDGRFESSFKPPVINRFGSIGVRYGTSGMAVLSGSRVLLPSHPSLWLDTGDPKLLSIYDRKGTNLRSFGDVKRYESPELTLNANIVYLAADDEDHIYVAYAHQNILAKYSPEGEKQFSADRPLPYDIQNVMTVEVFKSGNTEREFPWPSVSSVSRGIHIDPQKRIWVLTFLKQPNRFMSFDEKEDLTECYAFDVFDEQGILLFRVPCPNVRFDGLSICGDRVYLIDSSGEACVHEYRMIDRD